MGRRPGATHRDQPRRGRERLGRVNTRARPAEVLRDARQPSRPATSGLGESPAPLACTPIWNWLAPRSPYTPNATSSETRCVTNSAANSTPSTGLTTTRIDELTQRNQQLAVGHRGPAPNDPRNRTLNRPEHQRSAIAARVVLSLDSGVQADVQRSRCPDPGRHDVLVARCSVRHRSVSSASNPNSRAHHLQPGVRAR